MKIFSTLQTLSIAALLISSTAIVNAASHAAAPTAPATSAAQQDSAKSNLPMATAEIRKIDVENKKITLKHGEIKNLDMPSMTMVFGVKDAAMLDKLAAGDKVMFTADKVGSTFTVMSIEKAK
jgi:Cu(I)/Ag(I) efflux system periplasmic protein CusF